MACVREADEITAKLLKLGLTSRLFLSSPLRIFGVGSFCSVILGSTFRRLCFGRFTPYFFLSSPPSAFHVGSFYGGLLGNTVPSLYFGSNTLFGLRRRS